MQVMRLSKEAFALQRKKGEAEGFLQPYFFVFFPFFFDPFFLGIILLLLYLFAAFFATPFIPFVFVPFVCPRAALYVLRPQKLFKTHVNRIYVFRLKNETEESFSREKSQIPAFFCLRAITTNRSVFS